MERDAIALLSIYRKEPLDAPSSGWLGHHCDRERVRSSGLCNSNHVDEAYDPAFLRYTGDDGRSDILWYHDANGQVVLWEMNGTSILKNSTAGSTAQGWDVIVPGDFNHDGRVDIHLQNAAGALAEWLMEGNKILASQGIGSISTDWHVI